MKKIVVLFSVLVLASCNPAKFASKDLAINAPIQTAINLSAVANDKVPVTINPGRFTQKTVIYRMPRVVQGTYAVSDFGKYIEAFKAIDYDGNELDVEKLDVNSWTITHANKLDKIMYLVNDTFDVEVDGGIGKEVPFSPSGTNIELDNYVLNLHGFIGYFDSLKNNAYKLDITAPDDFIRTSSLPELSSKKSEDKNSLISSYLAPRYFDITDNPIFYGDLDVEEFEVGDIKIVLSVYSPNNKHTAESLKETVYKMMQAQKKYLGDINSTTRYDIYLYLSEGKPDSPKGFGALEHHTSTVVVLPESMDKMALAESMIDVVSHEFFHIVTPLSVHSEDVHYFDYNTPTFSKHLWMYEGVTEYFATLFQIHQDLVNKDAFYGKILEKMEASKRLDDAMSFTIMSENVITAPYKDQYLNVYQKGALIGMCIDILLREASDGKRGILSLMKALSNKYGKNKPFEDDTLFNEITSMTYPSIGDFLKTHVSGDLPINYNDFFEKVGLEIGSGRVASNYIVYNGQPIVSGSPSKGIFFLESVLENSFWVEQGVKPGDTLTHVDGVEVSLRNSNEVLGNIFSWRPGRKVEVKIERDGKEILIQTITTQNYSNGIALKEKENATEIQKALRQAWLKG